MFLTIVKQNVENSKQIIQLYFLKTKQKQTQRENKKQ